MANHSGSANGFVFGAASNTNTSGASSAGSTASGASVGSQRDAGKVQDRHLPTSLSEQVNRLEILHKIVERFGVPVVLLGIILWWARNDLIEPLLRAHFDFIDAVTACQKAHTEELQVIGKKLDELIEVSKDK